MDLKIHALKAEILPVGSSSSLIKLQGVDLQEILALLPEKAVMEYFNLKYETVPENTKLRKEMTCMQPTGSIWLVQK